MKRSAYVIIVALLAVFVSFTACKESKKGTTGQQGVNAPAQIDEELSAEDQAKIDAFADEFVRLEKSRQHLEREISAGKKEKSEIEKLDETQIAFDDKLNEFLINETRRQAYKEAVKKARKKIL